MTPECFSSKVKALHGNNWLHALSKVTCFSESYIAEKLDYHKNYDLPTHFENELSRVFSEFDDQIINSKFEIVEILEDYRSGDINYLKIKFRNSLIDLDFYNGKMVPTLEDCSNYLEKGVKTGSFYHLCYKKGIDNKKSVERWQSVLQTFAEEEMDFLNELQNQINYLNKAIVYRAPSKLRSRGSIEKFKERALLLYKDRSQSARYIQTTAPENQNLTFLV